MQKVKFKIYTLGCKVNQYDSKNLAKKLLNCGLSLVKQNSDLAIINSCVVTKNATKKGRSMINKARKENPNAKILLMGCWAKVYENEIDKKDIDISWRVGNLDKLVKKIKTEFKIENQEIKHAHKYLPAINNNVSRYFLKVQDGCDQFCSYCAIPYARGRLKSRPEQEILDEAKIVCENGFSEIILCGIHLGLYGQEKNFPEKDKTLNSLLKNLLKIKSLGRLRLSSIEVTEVDDELIDLIHNNHKMCKHLHISLQSGNNKVLKDMNRPYTSEEFKAVVTKIRNKMPNFAISTDIIVGFPGETDENFTSTHDFVEDLKFCKTHVFSFSAHEKTKAWNMEPKIKPEIIKERSEKLRKIGQRIESEYKNQFKNKNLEIVIEHIANNIVKCKTEFFFDFNINKSDLNQTLQNIPDTKLIGQITKATFK